MKKCIDHMRLKHSFYILDIDCVSSLKGLMTYIAERIQLGYLCLFCNKMFRNARRCQQHMMDKSHCFMNVNDDHEYEQYYDFSKTYEGHPDVEPTSEQEEGMIPLLTKKSSSENMVAKADEWEDVDVEDNSDEEEGKQSSPLKADSEPFSIITSDDKDTSKGAFTLIEGESDIKF